MLKINSKSLLVVLACIVVFLVWLLYNTQVRLFEFKNQVSKLETTNQEFTQRLTKDSLVIAEQGQIILGQKDAIRLGLLEVDRLKKVKSQVKTITKIQIDSVVVPYLDTLRLTDTVYRKGTINVPKRFLVAQDHYTLGGLVRLNDVMFDSILVTNEMKITIGQKNNGFFKKTTPIVEVENSNPYINVVDMNNVVIENKKRIYERPLFWAGVGLLGGIIIAK